MGGGIALIGRNRSELELLSLCALLLLLIELHILVANCETVSHGYLKTQRLYEPKEIKSRASFSHTTLIHIPSRSKLHKSRITHFHPYIIEEPRLAVSR